MLIYLNGTSSSGKTTLALELQKLIPKPAMYFSIDTLLYSLGEQDLEAIMGKRAYRFPLDWDAIFAGYLSCVASLIRAGNFVIADCPIHNEKLAKQFEKFVMPLEQKFLVGLYCSLSTLEARESERKDRAIGVARKQFEGIHKYLQYEIKVDTEQKSELILSQEIYSRMNQEGLS